VARITRFMALAVLAIAVAPSSWAQSCTSPLYNYTIDTFNSSTVDNPPVDIAIGGSGVLGTNFTACEESAEIQLGLRINQRADGYIVPVNDNQYVVPTGAAGDGNLKWNIDVHVDMGYDYGTAADPDQLSHLTSLVLQYDCEPAVGVVSGPAFDLINIAGFFPSTIFDVSRLIQVSDNLGFPARCPGMEIDPDANGSYEFSLTAYYNDVEVGHVEAVAVAGEPPTIPTPGDNAAFAVVKTFEDLNTQEVEVELNCFTGLPLTQSQDLSPWYTNEVNTQVTFIVTDFDDGELDCTLSETPVPGYTAEYVDLTGTGSVDEDGCHYEDALIGNATICSIINRVDPVPVTVVKEWIGVNSDEEFTSEIDLACFNTVGDGETEWEFHSSSDNGTDTFTVYVQPSYDGSTYCTVDEHNYDSGVEVAGCEDDISVDIGQTDAGCTITNTVFYEGIPTLTHYGLALLALLMVGLGFVGFRRLV